MEEILKFAGDRQVLAAREITKMFETVYRGSLAEVLEQIKETTPRGEYVVIVSSIKY